VCVRVCERVCECDTCDALHVTLASNLMDTIHLHRLREQCVAVRYSVLQSVAVSSGEVELQPLIFRVQAT